VGGTGPLGVGLALRFALAGEDVIVGSRGHARAEHAARRLHERLAALAPAGCVCEASDNATAVRTADVVALTVPFAALAPLLAELAPALAGKLILDVINPLEFVGGFFRLVPVAAGSAGGLIQSLVPQATVVSAFKHISARELWHAERVLHGDVLVCADAADPKHYVSGVVTRIPQLRPIDAGPLGNAAYLESVTPLLLTLNRQHHASTSVQILGI
jgi:NADPH-dependent F420 reductase